MTDLHQLDAISSDLAAVAPALAAYTRNRLQGELWQRARLAPRDRALVTLAALIARNQISLIESHFELALDHGLSPSEISELITHLAFYSGFGNAIAAAAVLRSVYQQRNITPDQLPGVNDALLPLDQAAEAKRAERVEADLGSVAPGVVQYTTELLFRDLWLRPALRPRDRSLITVSALIASAQVAQIPYHLNRAMDAGLTQSEAAKALTQLAFYAGWPNVFSALPVVKDVFKSRPGAADQGALSEAA